MNQTQGPPPPPGGAPQPFGPSGGPQASRLEDRARRFADPESMIAAFIITCWTAIAMLPFSLVGLVLLLVVTWLLHGLAVQTGQPAFLWMATGSVLIVSMIPLLGGAFPAGVWAFAGATALAYFQLVSLNGLRRRQAEVDVTVFQISGIAIAASGAAGVLGVSLADAVAREGERSWLWVPASLAMLFVLGLAMAVVPTRFATATSRERWVPGERIPPAPVLPEDDFDTNASA